MKLKDRVVAEFNGLLFCLGILVGFMCIPIILIKELYRRVVNNEKNKRVME